MSTRRSPVPDAEEVRRAADEHRRQPPVATDPRFAAVRRARVGPAVIVSEPDGKPAFWIVPFGVDDRASGYARLDLSARVGQIAIFGNGPADRATWPDLAFFDRPPAAMIAEARARYPGLRLQDARLSYDGSPSKWGWRLDTDREDGLTVLVTPNGWYARGPSHSRNAAHEG